jgi:signal transduction histidine kinase
VDYAPNPVLDEGIREGLFRNPGQNIDYFAEYLEFDRFSEVEAARALADYIGRKYAGKHIDVVIAMTMRAMRFAVDHRKRLFPTAPIVFAAPANDPVIRDAGPRITGVKIANSYSATLTVALALMPQVKQAFVVAISPNLQNVATVQDELRPLSRRVELTYVQADSVPALLDAVRAVPRGSLILYIWYQRAGDDYVTDALEPARLVADAARVPVFGVVDSVIGTGVVGGIVRGTRATGTRVGEMARRILDGTRPADIPIESAPLLPMFDWRQLQRWGIDLARLPRGADIQFRVPTVWTAYRRYIVAAFIVIIGQLLLIAGLLTQRAKRQRVEGTLRAREATLRTSYVRIRQLAGRLIDAQETARAKIARDLHDDVCQELVGVSMTASALRRSFGAIQDEHAKQRLAQLERSAQKSVDSIRRLSHDLHPASLGLLGLDAVLKGYCQEVEKRHGVEVSFSGTGHAGGLPRPVTVCLFRIAQEALRNGVVHGSARRLTVSLVRTDSSVELSVTDDGRGFDLEEVRRDGDGLGLVSIEERAHAVGGSAQIETEVNHGTTILVRVPASAPAHAHGGEVPVPAGPTDGAGRSVKELHRTRRAISPWRPRVSSRAVNEAAPVGVRNAAGRQAKEHV